jgi:hypothetical protein
MINMVDDPIRLFMRWIGKDRSPGAPKPTRFSSARAGLKGNIAFMPIMGVAETMFAPKGHKMSAFAGGAARMAAYTVGDFVGTLAGGPLLGFTLGTVTEGLGSYVEEGVQILHDFNRNIKHINMGGDYEDTQVAYTMRQRAAQELGRSAMNARQWLGREALFMHQ